MKCALRQDTSGTYLEMKFMRISNEVDQLSHRKGPRHLGHLGHRAASLFNSDVATKKIVPV